ncbi:MAG: hypothetical protein AABX55_01770 [Nanoarchaeota archaeon]
MSLHQFKSKEERIREQKRKEILEALLKDDSIIKDEGNIYAGLQATDDQFESEAYIMGKKYGNFGLDEVLAYEAILKFGNYNKALEFTDFYFKELKGDISFYIQAVENAAKNGFSYTPKEVSLFEQENMNLQNRFNLDLNQTYHRDRVASSEHYYEHLDSRLDRSPGE